MSEFLKADDPMTSLVFCSTMRCCTFVVAILCPAVLQADLSDADITVLKGLLAAQRAAEQALPQGRAKGSAENEFTGTKATFDAVWDGDNYYIDADCTEVILQPSGENADVRTHRIEIRTPNGRDYYQPENRLLQRITDNRSRSWPILDQLPRDMWFNPSTTTRNSTWGDLLDRQLGPESPWDTSVEQLPDGRILLINKAKVAPGASYVVYSLAEGGNVVTYWSEVPESVRGNSNGRGEYKWTQVSSDKWRLREFIYSATTSLGDEKKLIVQIDEFEPEPAIRPDRFDISSLQLPPGTFVEELGANETRYRIGEDSASEPGISIDQFRTLARSLREKGFGKPK